MSVHALRYILDTNKQGREKDFYALLLLSCLALFLDSPFASSPSVILVGLDADVSEGQGVSEQHPLRLFLRASAYPRRVINTRSAGRRFIVVANLPHEALRILRVRVAGYATPHGVL